MGGGGKVHVEPHDNLPLQTNFVGRAVLEELQ